MFPIRKSRHHEDTGRDRVFYFGNGLFLTLFLLITLYPLLCVVSGAISSPSAVYTGQVSFYPVGFSLRGFELNLNNTQVIRGFLNSLFYTVAGTALNVFVTLITGFAFSRKELIGRSFLSFLFAFTMWRFDRVRRPEL